MSVRAASSGDYRGRKMARSLCQSYSALNGRSRLSEGRRALAHEGREFRKRSEPQPIEKLVDVAANVFFFQLQSFGDQGNAVHAVYEAPKHVAIALRQPDAPDRHLGSSQGGKSTRSAGAP